MKKTIAAILSLTLIVSALAGCSDSGSSKTDAVSSVQTADNEATGSQAPAKTNPLNEEPDFMGMFVGSGSTEYIGMTSEEFNKATNNIFTKDNAYDYESFGDGDVNAKYNMGSKDSILGGRVSLWKKFDVVCTLKFKSDKLSEIQLRIEKLEKDEAKVITDNFLAAFEGKLPEGYKQFTPVKHGKKSESGFTKGQDDYVFSVTTDENLDGDTYLYFSMQIYAERYGMNK